MTRDDLVDGLRALSHKQFVEVFYEAVQGRDIYSEESNIWDAHLVLANAVRERDEGSVGPWQVELICPTPGQDWQPDLWTEEAVRTHEKWQEVRKAARRVLADFGWDEGPPKPKRGYVLD